MTLRQKETRYMPGMDLLLTRAADAPPVLSGHIAVFNQLSDDLGGWREKIDPGAFAETIRTQDIRALWNHEDGLVLGRISAGTLSLSEDQIGLAFKNTPPDTTWFKDRMVSLERKDVTGASFAFFTDDDAWGTMDDGTRVRTLKKVTLVEVSPGVTFPAYPQTDAAMRSMEAWLKRQKEMGSRQTPPDPATVSFRERKLRLNELSL